VKSSSIVSALAAAVLFGASTPAAKALAGEMHPVMLAGLLYAGSGIGLGLWILLAKRKIALQRSDIPWLLGAVVAGGVAGPVLLMAGLARSSASSASLLLNLEGVFTALLAWFAFKENFEPGALRDGYAGALAVAAACLAWAVDNNLTRRVSTADAGAIAAIKGLTAGIVNLVLAFAVGAAWPGAAKAVAAASVGLFGYGVSLVLFIVALRDLGAARTGAYFSTAPFVGVALAIVALGEMPTPLFWPAAALMVAGVWLHVSERHEHQHQHEPIEHEHDHGHDEHHRHRHGPEWDGKEPHVHRHRHAQLVHRHPHYPDIHHRHH
jgi:drug/metabolite transporter (DMT)-like permease